MSKTGFKCPECGNTESFTANCYVVYNAELTITADGWVDNGKYGDMELPDHADLTCGECEYEGNWREFREEW